MRWTKEMSAGVPIIDRWHHELVNRLNNLRAAIRKQVCRFTIEETIAFLDEHAEIHFCIEEKYMSSYGFPGYLVHKEKHAQFAEEVHFLNEELHNIRTLGLKGSYELSVEVVQVVVGWIHDHVMTYDRELGAFLGHYSYISSDGLSAHCGSRERITERGLTICSICHKIRGRKGVWKQKECYREIPSDIDYSHAICPECLQNHYSDLFAEKR